MIKILPSSLREKTETCKTIVTSCFFLNTRIDGCDKIQQVSHKINWWFFLFRYFPT